ncbi:MAG TPA: type IV pilus secretin PilQ family protein [Gammaproteobacteria bacterium]|nr:type IV pilus secretin PilQ family protein [Gammaproteobacteria bacterium]
MSVSATSGRLPYKIIAGLLFTLSVLLPGLAFSEVVLQPEVARIVEKVDISPLPDNKVQVRLTFNGAPLESEPLSFTIDNPARVALDFPETSSSVPRRHLTNVGVVRSVHVVEAKGRTRVVLNLSQMVPYETRVDGNNVYITLEGSAPSSAGKAAAPAFSLSEESADISEGSAFSIKSVDFQRGSNGEGRIIVKLSDPAIPVNVSESANRIVIDFNDAKIPAKLQRRMDVVDFATPVTMIDSFANDGNVRLVVETIGEFDHMAYQSGDTFTLEVRPVSKEEQELARLKQPEYKGDRLSLSFQDIEVRAVLQLIADFTGMNLVTSDSVEGSVTLRLKNVPWDQALDIILKTKGLAMRKTGNVILVAPSEEIAAREKQELESQQQVKELAPLFTDMIQVNYAKAEDIATLLKAEENTLLSERGKVTIDERTNSLLVRDTAEKLDEIRRLVAKLDIPVRQVLIESRIVIASDNFGRDLGVRFGASGVGEINSDTFGFSSGSLSGTDTMVGTSPPPVSLPGLSDRLNVNLPVANPAGQIAFAVLGSDFLVDLELSAMQAEGQGEIVSSPRVITANQSEAVIEQGTEIPYQQAASSGATTVTFKKAVLSLRVTPQITPDDRIIMDLEVSKDNVGEVFLGVPSIETRAVETQVLVDNGETVVLGGIYEQTRLDEIDSVPVLGDVPVLGALFRQTRKQDDKRELLIFVTPKILKEELTLR